MKLMLSFTTAPNRKIMTNNDYRNRESRTNRAGRGELERAAGACLQEPCGARAAHDNADDRVSQRRVVLGICTDGGRLPQRPRRTGLLIVVLALVNRRRVICRVN